jgi:hypothetical protein
VIEIPVEHLIPGDRVVSDDGADRVVLSVNKTSTGRLVPVTFKDPLGEVNVTYSRGRRLKVRPR